jgi:predicted ATPase
MARRGTRDAEDGSPFLLRLQLVRDRITDANTYPFSIPAIAAADGLALHPQVTYFVGENGSGKSTLLEAIAVAAGFNPEGGSMNFRFSTRSSESSLAGALRLIRSVRRPPILLAYPGAWIYELDEHGLRRVEYDDTATVRVTRDFLGDRDATLADLFSDD